MKNLIILVIAIVAALMTLAPTAAQAQQPQAACESGYTVQPGDWLGKVAGQTYGDAALYPAIAAATNANLGPDYVNFIGANNVILPGWKLCLPSQADAVTLAAAATDDPATLTVDDLQNATYTEYAEAAPVTLVNGEYRQPVPESTAEEVYSLADTFAFADFDGDGSEDALAVLISDTAGTGRFFTLMLLLNKNGVPTQADSVSLGDRSPMKAINLVGGDIYVDYITQGPNDAACCATQATSQKFRVKNGKLVTSEADIQASQTSEAMTREKLGNIAYPIDEGEQITFVNGKYVGQPEGEGSASFSAAEMLAPLAFGDLTGDGVEDAVVTFSYSGGGSGDFLYLAVAEGKGAEPVGQASVWLDTAGQINGVAVDNGQVKVDVLRFGPGDAECCATEHAVVTYTLQDGALVEGEAQIIAPTAPAPAPGERITSVVELTAVPVQWLSFTDPTQQFDIANPENYTIAFNPDGTVNVKADCNNAAGTYTAADSGSLTIQLGPMTLAACPPDSRSDEFVQSLGFVRNFFMENGFVYLDMLADGGTLKLAPASESMAAP